MTPTTDSGSPDHWSGADRDAGDENINTPKNGFGKPVEDALNDGLWIARSLNERYVSNYLTAHGWTNIDDGAGLLWTHPRVKSVRTRIAVIDSHAVEVQRRWTDKTQVSDA